MSHSASPLPDHGWRRNLALGTFFVGIAIFLLSFVTFFLTVKETNFVYRLGNALYSGARLLLLHFDPGSNEDIPWPLEIARLLAPLVLGSTALLALYEIFRNPIRLWILSRRGNHVVVCGLNEQNLHLIRELRRRGDPVIVIDMNPVNELLPSAEEIGAIALVGDATTANMLRKACVERAEYLIVREVDDGRNVEIGLSAIPVRTQHVRPGSPALHCFLHLAHLELRHLFRQHEVLAKRNDQVVPHLFTTYENSARSLFNNCPLEPFKFGPDDPRNVHLVIIGFGQMGESVALQATKISHFANGRKLCLTVIDRKASARKERLYTYYPYFGEICDAEFVEADADDPALATNMVKWSEDGGSITTFVICFDDDLRSLTYALHLRHRIDRRAPIRVRMASSAGLTTLIYEGADSSGIPSNLTAFGGLNEANKVELIIGEKLDLQAKVIHEDFVERRIREGDLPEKNSALVPWNQLGAVFVESNRQQADHIMIKLRGIGCYSSPPKNEPPYRFSEKSEIELLARMEHARWIAERRLAGWMFAPGEKDAKDEKHKTSPYLVGWDQLDEKVRDYDRDAVLDIPRLLELINEKIYR